jgi:hypothetical protein
MKAAKSILLTVFSYWPEFLTVAAMAFALGWINALRLGAH